MIENQEVDMGSPKTPQGKENKQTKDVFKMKRVRKYSKRCQYIGKNDEGTGMKRSEPFNDLTNLKTHMKADGDAKNKKGKRRSSKICTAKSESRLKDLINQIDMAYHLMRIASMTIKMKFLSIKDDEDDVCDMPPA